jgi:hypothetical protein
MRCSAIRLCIAVLVAALGVSAVAGADEPKMSMPMSDAPAHFKPTRAAYTADHRFLVKLLSLPSPIPYQKHFSVRLAVYEGRSPHKQLSDAKVEITAGMRHGMTHGFAHSMDSAPKLAMKDGVLTVSGLYFHMTGTWVLEANVDADGITSSATFELPCCGH